MLITNPKPVDKQHATRIVRIHNLSYPKDPPCPISLSHVYFTAPWRNGVRVCRITPIILQLDFLVVENPPQCKEQLPKCPCFHSNITQLRHASNTNVNFSFFHVLWPLSMIPMGIIWITHWHRPNHNHTNTMVINATKSHIPHRIFQNRSTHVDQQPPIMVNLPIFRRWPLPKGGNKDDQEGGSYNKENERWPLRLVSWAQGRSHVASDDHDGTLHQNQLLGHGSSFHFQCHTRKQSWCSRTHLL